MSGLRLACVKVDSSEVLHPQFIYAGVKRGEELAEFYASADVFVFPSTTETFGNVRVEAMASGLAVVGYDCAAARQHIINGENGYSVPFDQEDSFIETAILAAQSDVFELRQKARASTRKVRWKKVIKRFKKRLKNLVSEDSGETADTRSPQPRTTSQEI